MEREMTPEEAQLNLHIPHRLCLLTAFRDRQPWFRNRIGQADCDLLRTSKDAALLSIRMFAEFLGLKPAADRGDGVFIEMLGGRPMKIEELPSNEQSLIKGLLRRANKELAHVTSTFVDHDEFNTARALVEGITIIERLLHDNLYKVLNRPFPTLVGEKKVAYNEWQFVYGPPEPTAFPGR